MKKLALILAMLMVIPSAAFGLEMLNDSAMDDVTGQAGVSIAFDDIQIFMNIERIAWIDTDGFNNVVLANQVFSGTGGAGAIGLNNFQLDVLEINAIVSSTTGGFDLESCGDLGLNFDYDSTTQLGGGQLSTAYGAPVLNDLGLNNYDSAVNDTTGGEAVEYAALTIDATNELPALSIGLGKNTGATAHVGGVIIGLPTAEFYIPSLSLTPAFFNVQGATASYNDIDGANGTHPLGAAADALLPAADFGTIAMEGITFTTLSGWLEIAPH